MESFLARDPNMKSTAQRAFVAYAKSVALMRNKAIFNVQELDTDSFAKSLGLAIPPRIRFLQRRNIAQREKTGNPDDKTPNNHLKFGSDESEDDEKVTGEPAAAEEKKKANANFHVSDDSEDDEDDGFLQVKRRDHDAELPTEEDLSVNSGGGRGKKALTKAAVAKKMMKKKIVANRKIVFDEEGEAVPQGTKEKLSKIAQSYENSGEGGIDIEEARKVLREEDVFDKQRFRAQVKAKHKETKRKLKEKKLAEAAAERDDFGSGSDEDGPDLSWLPDPDKIYGPRDAGEDKADNEDDNEGEEEAELELEKPSKKRKTKKAIEKKSKKKSKLDAISASLSVNEAEELALMLLRKK